MLLRRKGEIIILSSPSGAGKTTLVKKISRNKNYITSISHTTRKPREYEKNGKDYYFVTKKKFKTLIKKRKFLEYAKVFGNFYGSSKGLVIDKLLNNKNVVFDIDWQGTRQIRNKKLKFVLKTIFILPPSRKELIKRLTKRENKNISTVKKRMREFKKDVKKWKEYDYVVINDNLNKCYSSIMKFIISKKKNSRKFNKKKISKHVANLLA